MTNAKYIPEFGAMQPTRVRELLKNITDKTSKKSPY
jgi:hypothetical protein